MIKCLFLKMIPRGLKEKGRYIGFTFRVTSSNPFRVRQINAGILLILTSCISVQGLSFRRKICNIKLYYNVKTCWN